mmetsp:Transcript_33071/g.105390  ORF Transcript_33071/g.105390 Transcript_33071/m.105390 type:complete len:216 (+) Transcript_33071:3538-4185(+)
MKTGKHENGSSSRRATGCSSAESVTLYSTPTHCTSSRLMVAYPATYRAGEGSTRSSPLAVRSTWYGSHCVQTTRRLRVSEGATALAASFFLCFSLASWPSSCLICASSARSRSDFAPPPPAFSPQSTAPLPLPARLPRGSASVEEEAGTILGPSALPDRHSGPSRLSSADPRDELCAAAAAGAAAAGAVESCTEGGSRSWARRPVARSPPGLASP